MANYYEASPVRNADAKVADGALGAANNGEYPLNSIYFYVAEGCNLRCRHCWIGPKHENGDHSYRSLDLELFQSVLDQGKPLGLSRVKLTGGEPFVHPQIHKALHLLSREDLRLVVETNGVLCTPAIAHTIGACADPFVAVSLDGVDAETHEWVRGVPGCFEAALVGIQNLVRAGIRPQIVMSIMRRNQNQLQAVVRLAESLGAGSVKFNIVQPSGGGQRMHGAGETPTIDELVNLGQWIESSLSASTELPVCYSHPLAFRPLGKMLGADEGECGVCDILGVLGVLADGSYALCGIGETIPDLVFGHAATDRLHDVWNHAPVLLELREALPGRLGGICGDCLLKGPCLGSCIAQNYYRSKDLFAPFWYCEAARAAGLFPESRIRPQV